MQGSLGLLSAMMSPSDTEMGKDAMVLDCAMRCTQKLKCRDFHAHQGRKVAGGDDSED